MILAHCAPPPHTHIYIHTNVGDRITTTQALNIKQTEQSCNQMNVWNTIPRKLYPLTQLKVPVKSFFQFVQLLDIFAQTF